MMLLATMILGVIIITLLNAWMLHTITKNVPLDEWQPWEDED